MKFGAPLALLFLLLAIPIILLAVHPELISFLYRRRLGDDENTSTNVHSWFLIGLRLLSVFCLILALAQLYRSMVSNQRSIALVIDLSDSIPTSVQQSTQQYSKNVRQRLTDNDTVQVVVFGQRPALVSDLSAVHSVSIDRSATDIAAALQIASSTFSLEAEKRLVLLTDGQQTQGDLETALDLLAASQIQTFVVPLNLSSPPTKESSGLQAQPLEVIVHDLQVPTTPRPSEQFRLRALIESNAETEAIAELWQTDGSTQQPIIQNRRLQLKAGKQVIQFQHRIDRPGYYQFQLSLLVADQFQENNQALAVTYIATESPEILYVSRTGNSTFWPILSQAANFKATQIPSTRFPRTLPGLRPYHAIILDNLPASVFSDSQLKMIQNYVGQVGGGLAVIGGKQAFGLGGYHGTLLETILPVEMTPKQRKRSMAMVMLLDTSGSMANQVGGYQKIHLALEGVRSAVMAMDKTDQVSVIGFAEKIQHDIPLTTDHLSVIRALRRFQPSGGTQMLPALEQAYQRLQAASAKQKHLLILSDGKSDGDFNPLIQKIVAAQISISTIAVGDAAEAFLRSLATVGQGSYRHVKNTTQLPRILVDQVRQSRKYAVEEPTQPIFSDLSPMLTGITSLPELDGYVATSAKDNAQVLIESDSTDPENAGQPILAWWNYGLGKTAAFTSDTGGRWSHNWRATNSETFSWDRFWIQLLGSVVKSTANSDFELQTQMINGSRGTEGVVRLEGQLGNTLTAIVACPNGEQLSVTLQRIAKDQAQGTFPLNQTGIYTVSAEVDGQQQISSLVVSYPLEYRYLTGNRQLLGRIAWRTNGILNPSVDQITTPARQKITRQHYLARPLLLISLLVFAVELVCRRWLPFQPKRPAIESSTNQERLVPPQPIVEGGNSLQTQPSLAQLHVDQLLFAKRRAAQSEED